ncbi:PREDICTED: cadherin-2-like, partial [Priapulus caudatus]|uniref:Cadherin-2-like n=1 Tax=Priapulus caudatus TaxID=37621 RepID=A0ABM1F4E8_PRICU
LWLKTISFTDNQGQMQGKVTKVVSVATNEELLEKVIAFSPGPTEAQLNITVASLLDRETIAEYKISWSYKDVRDDYGWIEPPNILFTVEDVNDNPPEWHDLPPDNKVEVEE